MRGQQRLRPLPHLVAQLPGLRPRHLPALLVPCPHSSPYSLTLSLFPNKDLSSQKTIEFALRAVGQSGSWLPDEGSVPKSPKSRPKNYVSPLACIYEF